VKSRRFSIEKVLALGGCLLIGYFGYSYLSFREAVEVGAEYPGADAQEALGRELQEHFSWSGLPPACVERGWSNGFQDHTNLYRVRVGPDVVTSLRQAILAKTGEDITVDDRDDLSLCPHGFATTAPEGFHRMRVPAWWEASSLRNFEAVRWDSFDWGIWFGYDRERQVLFVRTYNS
jgi:hypothetical protein